MQSREISYFFNLMTVIVISLIIVSSSIQIALTKSMYLGIMENLNNDETKIGLRQFFEKDMTYTELLDWEKERLVYEKGAIERNEDPFKILEYGKGRCGEFTILYVALCLAHGHRTRIVVDVFGDHLWAEVLDGNIWVHVDTEGRINEPYMYERDWGKKIRLVYAFEENKVVDVTLKYRVG